MCSLSLPFRNARSRSFLLNDPVARRSRSHWDVDLPRAEEWKKRERDRRSEQRKITTVNGVVQRNAATVANATMYRQLPCRCRYRDPTNIYSYDNRYAPACYLNSAACNLRISALYTPTLLRDLCFAPTFRLPHSSQQSARSIYSFASITSVSSTSVFVFSVESFGIVIRKVFR